MSARHFLIFINPISGTGDKAVVRKYLEKEFLEHQLAFEFCDTNAAGCYNHLKEKIETESITDVVVCGGDGTVSQIAFYLQHNTVNVGIIPLGSGNGLALAAGISRNYRKAFAVILAGKAAPIDAFMINDRFSCMLCGLGFDAQVAHDFAKQKTRGLGTYFKQTVRNFLSAKPYAFEVISGDEKFSTDAYFISIANSNQFGNNFTIAPMASLSDGLLDIVIVKKTGKVNLILKVIQQVRNGTVKKDRHPAAVVEYFQTRYLTILNPHSAPLHIDGDPAETAEMFNIRIIEKAFLLLQP